MKVNGKISIPGRPERSTKVSRNNVEAKNGGDFCKILKAQEKISGAIMWWNGKEITTGQDQQEEK